MSYATAGVALCCCGASGSCTICPTDCSACDCTYTVEVSDIDLSCNASCTGTLTCGFVRNEIACPNSETACLWGPETGGDAFCDSSGNIQLCNDASTVGIGQYPDSLIQCVVVGGVAYWQLAISVRCNQSGCCGIQGCADCVDAYAIWRVAVADSPCASACPPTAGWTLFESAGFASDPTLSVSSA